jgi:hypothetical protein
MLNDGQCFVELGSVNEITRVGHPKDIAGLGSYDVGQCATHRHFHFSYLMEEELPKTAIELIKSYGCRKTTLWLEPLHFFGEGNKRIHVRAEAVVSYIL